MEFSAIYKIESKIHPDRIYVGSAKQTKSRWCLHLADLKKNRHHSSKLQNHYNKYGKEDLVFVVIEPCFPEFLLVREQYYIDTLKPFFNCSPTACSTLGLKWSAKARKNLSDAKKGKPCPTKGIKRKGMSDEFKKRCAENMKGNSFNKGKHWKWTDEQKQNNLIGENNPFFGKHHTKESIDKANKSRIGQLIWNKGLNKEQQIEYRNKKKLA
jgi:group I intron endonuclease